MQNVHEKNNCSVGIKYFGLINQFCGNNHDIKNTMLCNLGDNIYVAVTCLTLHMSELFGCCC